VVVVIRPLIYHPARCTYRTTTKEQKPAFHPGWRSGRRMATFHAAERRTLAKAGQAEPDGSYPIRNGGDLSNAIRDIGRGGNKPSDRAWIIRRAKELGLSSKIPLTWQGGK